MKKFIVTFVLLGAIGAAIYLLQQPTDGVRPVVWDKSSCAHCHMHVGVPSYAAQLQTKDGRVYDFDDPGCLFEWVVANHPRIEAAYFHHFRDDRWLDHREVGFLRVDEETPMGYGLAAVDRSLHDDALDFGDASNAALNMRDDRLDSPTSHNDHDRSRGGLR